MDNGILSVTAPEGRQVSIRVSKTGDSRILFDILRNNDESTADDGDIVNPTLPGNPYPGGDIYDRIGIEIPAGLSGFTNDAFSLPLARGDNSEGDETLVFDLANPREPDTGHRVEIGAISRLVLTIMNVPQTVVEFAEAAYSVIEGGTVSIDLIKTGPSAIRFTVTGDGVPPEDITSISGFGVSATEFPVDITIPGPNASGTLDLTPTWDNRLTEGDQTLNLRIDNVLDPMGQNNHVAIGVRDSTVVTIMDVKVEVAFARRNYRVNEGEKVEIEFDIDFNRFTKVGFVIRSQSPGVAVPEDFEIEANDGSQDGHGTISPSQQNTGNEDELRVEVTFDSDDTEFRVMLTAPKDYLGDGDKLVDLVIDQNDPHTYTEGGVTFSNANIRVGAIDRTTITIIDSGPTIVQFRSDQAHVFEPTSGQSFTARLFDIIPLEAIGKFGDVYFRVTPSPGVTEEDYTLPDFEVSDRPGAGPNEYKLVNANRFRIGANADNVNEKREIITIDLVDADNYALGNITSHVAFILPDLVKTYTTPPITTPFIPTTYFWRLDFENYFVFGELEVMENTPPGTPIVSSTGATGGTPDPRIRWHRFEVYEFLDNGQPESRFRVDYLNTRHYFRHTLGDPTFTYAEPDPTDPDHGNQMPRLNLRGDARGPNGFGDFGKIRLHFGLGTSSFPGPIGWYLTGAGAGLRERILVPFGEDPSITFNKLEFTGSR